MPVPFDPEKLHVIPTMVKSVSTALGGSIRVVNEDDEDDVKGLHIEVPFHLVRRFKGIAGGSKYLVPNKAEIIMYGDQPICFERFPYAAYRTEKMRETMQEDLDKWKSWSQRIFDDVVVPHVEKTKDSFMWCIDGYYIYALPKNKTDWVKTSQTLNTEGTFRSLRVKAFKVADFSVGKMTKIEKPESYMVEKDCLVFVAPTGEVFVTPPIWNHLGKIGSTKLEMLGDDGAGNGSDRVDGTLFDYIDKDLSINISFALDVAGRVSKRFGFECVEPLQLPELMVAYTTVNLKKLPNAVKRTGACGIQFTHTLAWLFGLFRDTDDFNDMLEFRAILKYLTSKGIQHSKIVSLESIYTQEYLAKEDKAVPMMDELQIAELKTEDQRSDLMVK